MAEEVAAELSQLFLTTEYEDVIHLNLALGNHTPLYLKRNLPYYKPSKLIENEPRHYIQLDIAATDVSSSSTSATSSFVTFVSVCAVLPATKSEPERYVPLVCTAFPGLPSEQPAGKIGLALPLALPDKQWYENMGVVVISQELPAVANLLTLTSSFQGAQQQNKTPKLMKCSIENDSLFQWLQPGSTVLSASTYEESEEEEEEKWIIQGVCTTVEMKPSALQVHLPQRNKTHNNNSNAYVGHLESVAARFPSFSLANDDDAVPPSLEALSTLFFDIEVCEVGKHKSDGEEKMEEHVQEMDLDAQDKDSNRDKKPAEENGDVNSADTSNAEKAADKPSNSVETPPPPTVVYCSADGRLQARYKLSDCSCPFEGCGMECRGLTGLYQHVEASHLYFDCWVSEDKPGIEPEIYIRAKPGWHDPRSGTFLPRELDESTLQNHPLVPLLFKTPFRHPFTYSCTPRQRPLRFARNAIAPKDTREINLEQRAEEEVAAYLECMQLEAGGDSRAIDSEAGPSTRRPPRPHRQHNAAAVNKAQEGVVVKKRPQGLALLTPEGFPKFYHSRTCLSMSKVEVCGVDDSDDEEELEDWKHDCHRKLFEQPDLCEEQREFMFEWNLFVHLHPVHADLHVPQRCVDFARAHVDKLSQDGPFRRCFLTHLTNLWKYRLLHPDHVAIVLEVAKGERGGEIVEMVDLDGQQQQQQQQQQEQQQQQREMQQDEEEDDGQEEQGGAEEIEEQVDDDIDSAMAS